jgi:lipopolysaccharide/colanic/teichoic acid biosynthesis glycosyltransferase
MIAARTNTLPLRVSPPPAPALAAKLPRPESWYLPLKVGIDFLLALVLLCVTGPLILIALMLVRVTSRGPVLYSQTRVGRFGRPFTIYKIRTMTHRAESLTGACWCTPGDTRITPVGCWLRKTHVDELPQLWNVLRGEMSLIGPRPERPEFVPQLEQAISCYRERLLVRPGLTGLAQVQLPPDTDLNSVRAKLAYDLFYVQSVSAWLDFRIGFATVLHVIGVPFRWIGAVCRFPRQEIVEKGYRMLIAEPRHAKVHSANGNGHVSEPGAVPALS